MSGQSLPGQPAPALALPEGGPGSPRDGPKPAGGFPSTATLSSVPCLLGTPSEPQPSREGSTCPAAPEPQVWQVETCHRPDSCLRFLLRALGCPLFTETRQPRAGQTPRALRVKHSARPGSSPPCALSHGSHVGAPNPHWGVQGRAVTPPFSKPAAGGARTSRVSPSLGRRTQTLGQTLRSGCKVVPRWP